MGGATLDPAGGSVEIGGDGEAVTPGVTGYLIQTIRAVQLGH